MIGINRNILFTTPSRGGSIGPKAKGKKVASTGKSSEGLKEPPKRTQEAKSSSSSVNKPQQPQLKELVDIGAVQLTKRIPTMRPVQDGTKLGESTILHVKDEANSGNLKGYVDELQTVAEELSQVVECLKDDNRQRELFRNRTEGDVVVAYLKCANVYIQAIAQYNSILEKLAAHRLNWIRSTDADGFGRTGLKPKVGDIVSVGNKRFRTTEDGFEEITS